MTREVATAEVFAAAVPVDVDPGAGGESGLTNLVALLEGIAYDYVLRHWSGKAAADRPVAVRGMLSDWLITAEPEDVEKFQPVHDCAECAAGNELARAFLRDNPGRWVALANLTYVEVWAT